MGEAKKKPLRLEFSRRVKLEFHGAKVAGDADRLRVDPAMRRVVGGRAEGSFRTDSPKDKTASASSDMMLTAKWSFSDSGGSRQWEENRPKRDFMCLRVTTRSTKR